MPTTSAIVSLAMDDGREVGDGEDEVVGCGELDLVVLSWLRLPYPASAGEGVPGEWRDMRRTCSKVGLPASLACSRHLRGEAGSGDAAEEGKEKLTLRPLSPPPPPAAGRLA